ncbi:hypothetical protein GQX74_005508 [Glossina fuscipes]|nr:hypothetical protein GQX74_005508 [Glossina fuscipes]
MFSLHTHSASITPRSRSRECVVGNKNPFYCYTKLLHAPCSMLDVASSFHAHKANTMDDSSIRNTLLVPVDYRNRGSYQSYDDDERKRYVFDADGRCARERISGTLNLFNNLMDDVGKEIERSILST